MHLAALYDALVPLPVFQALKAFPLQWPFPRAHSTTKFHDANHWAELCHTPHLCWAGQSLCCSRYPQWQHQLRELEIKETTETSASSSYLDCYLYIDNGKLTTRLYDKRDDFNFPSVNFPFLSSNIPSAPAYGVYVSQLIRYARTCSNYQDFMERGKVLTQKLLSQGYQKTKLVATLKKFYGRHHDLVNPYNAAVSRNVSDVFASDAP